jgi:hypothetical protein
MNIHKELIKAEELIKKEKLMKGGRYFIKLLKKFQNNLRRTLY